MDSDEAALDDETAVLVAEAATTPVVADADPPAANDADDLLVSERMIVEVVAGCANPDAFSRPCRQRPAALLVFVADLVAVVVWCCLTAWPAAVFVDKYRLAFGGGGGWW